MRVSKRITEGSDRRDTGNNKSYISQMEMEEGEKGESRERSLRGLSKGEESEIKTMEFSHLIVVWKL